MRPRAACPHVDRSAFAGFRFPPEVITVAVRWYLRFGRSYRGVEELLADRGVEVDHVTVYRWVQRFTPLLAEAGQVLRRSATDTCGTWNPWDPNYPHQGPMKETMTESNTSAQP